MAPLAAIGWPVVDRIRLGPVAVSPHGLGIAIGYLAGSWFMLREGKKRGLNEDHIGTILLWALVGAIFGARFFYVIGHLNEFDSFYEMLAIWRGGISLIGGITGAIIFAYPIMRRYRYRFLQVMDSAAIGLAFGIVIGRIGDLIIGDHLGKPTGFLLGFEYRGGNLPGYSCFGEGARSVCDTILPNGARQTVAYGDVVHQTALYDFFIAIGLFLLLRWMNRVPRREGVLIMTFAIVYGLGRVVTDLLRVDKTWFGLTGSQWAAIAAILISVITLIRFARRPLTPEEDDEGNGPARVSASPGAGDPGEGPPSTRFEPPQEPDKSGAAPP